MVYLITVVTLNLLFLITLFAAIFLGKKLLKKFKLYERFLSGPGRTRRLVFNWDGHVQGMMRKIVIRSNQSFNVLIGFWFAIPAFSVNTIDWYGYARSQYKDDHWEVIIETYMGRKPVEFHFQMKTEIETSPWETIVYYTDQETESMVIFPPHWWQRLGFFA